MSARIIPDNFLHHGHVNAIGFYFDLSIASEQIARERILALWVLGAKVFRVGDNLVLILPATQLIDTKLAPALPLIKIPGQRLLSGLPLTPKLLTTLENASIESIVIAVSINLTLPR